MSVYKKIASLSHHMLLVSAFATIGHAQSLDGQQSDEFASENAIVDTSILFAIGAREAQQELRGAFGWSTFQEGLVQGVYFRFDPDGYARFSPSPRLDTDVFEVVCRPRTFSCMGRKNGLTVALTSRGLVQLRFENALQTDQFFIAEGVSELPLPQSIIQPLDPRLELLLSSGGELLVKRGEAESERISLVGFSALTSYLRWISSRQDYVVLPRDWPVPNSNEDGTVIGLTQAANWQSPMPQPLFVNQAEPLTAAAPEIASPETSEPNTPLPASAILDTNTMMKPPEFVVAKFDEKDVSKLVELLSQQLDALEKMNGSLEKYLENYEVQSVEMAETQDPQKPEMVADPKGMNDAQTPSEDLFMSRLQFLTDEIGLPSDLAKLVLNSTQNDTVRDLAGLMPLVTAEESKVIDSSLGTDSHVEMDREFVLLSDYFKESSQ